MKSYVRKQRNGAPRPVFHTRHFFIVLAAFNGRTIECSHECDSPVYRMLKYDLSSLLMRCVKVLNVCMDAAFCQLLLWEWFSLLLICVWVFIVVALCSPSSYTLLFPFVFPALSVHVRIPAEDSIQCKKVFPMGQLGLVTALLFFYMYVFIQGYALIFTAVHGTASWRKKCFL